MVGVVDASSTTPIQSVTEATASEPEPVAEKTIEAKPSLFKVFLNGFEVDFDAYDINNNTYFKLHDLAYVLNGTEKEFDVAWDDVKKAIIITSDMHYTPIGGEMSEKTKESKIPLVTDMKVYLDDEEFDFTVYNIDNNMYFKLSDVAEMVNIYVEYDDNAKTIILKTNREYVDLETEK